LISRGDIVILEVYFSDRTGSKVRPALVVQNDLLNEKLDDTIVAIITSSQRRFGGDATQVRDDPDNESGRSPSCGIRRAMREPRDG
jgi:mRNA-degrading endonuclease toxin of MazEF toxin-antitoxin module